MKSCHTLPEGYTPLLTIDMKNNKKLAFGVNFGAILIMCAIFLMMPLFCPLYVCIADLTSVSQLLIRFAAGAIALLAYIVLHEAVHGLAMKICGTEKVRFGLTLLYAYAGSDDYYTKKAYIFIALAPIVLWGIVLSIVCAVVPPSWFFVFYFIQAMNIAGAAGDLYVSIRCLFLPSHILIRDWGTNMIVYSK